MRRRILGLTAAFVAVGLMAPGFSAALTRPAGTYTGHAETFSMVVAGRSIQIVGFDFRCRGTTGRTSLSAIPIRRARGRWRFSIRTFGSVTYRDDHPDENARVRVSGRFTPTAGRGTARVDITSRHCGRTTAWYAGAR